MGIKEINKNFDITLNYIMFPLHPETPDEGMTLEDLFAGKNVDIEGINQHYIQLTGKLGLDFSYRNMTYNSRLAQELSKWAQTQPDGERIHDALYRAYFVDAINLAQIDKLLKVIESLDMDINSAKEALENRLFKDAVDTDWNQSHQNGIRAVPSFVLNNQLLQGFHEYPTLSKFMQ